MAAGHPLTDEDRWPWLDTIAAWIDERVAAGDPAVVTCSALKKIYRDKLRRQGVVFVYMQGTFDEVMERLSPPRPLHEAEHAAIPVRHSRRAGR